MTLDLLERPADPSIAKKAFFGDMIGGLKTEKMSLAAFFPASWPIIEPGKTLISNWHIDCISEHLEAVLLGQIRDLIINLPPRNTKSNLVTVAFPTWAWTKRPSLQFMTVSYSASLSTKHSLDRRRILESGWYLNRWGKMVRIQSDQNQKAVYENTARGTMIATSKDGSATGLGADIILFDDLINPKEAESKAERESAIESFDLVFSSRLNDKNTGCRIIVEQRTHKDDLTGHCLKQGGWTHLSLPATAEERQTIIFPMSGRKVVREVGDILNPVREGKAVLARQLQIAGSRGYSAQYQQSPSSESGNMVKRHWFKFYQEDPRTLVQKMEIAIQSWDFAFKDNEDSSYVVGLVMGRLGADKYLFAEYRDHMDFSKTVQAVQVASKQWPMTGYKLYEDRANGPAVKSTLASKIPGLIPVEPTGSKEARMSAASPDIEAGNYYLPDPSIPGNEWVNAYIDEMANFPEEPNDRGDATAQGIVKLNAVIFVSEDIEGEGPMMDGLGGGDSGEVQFED